MRLIHNSRLPQFRTPFGAVTTGTSVSLSVILEDADPNQATLTLRTWVDEIGESLYPMTHEGDGIFTVELECAEPCLIWYSFICNIEGQPEVRLGAPQGRTGGEGVTYNYAEVPSFQITVYKHREVRPEWYERGMVYQIFPDRYARDENWRERTLAEVEKPRNGIQRRMVEDWNEPPEYERAEDGSIKTWDFYGGSLKGIQNDLPRIAELGFTAIYLNPIFEAASNHRYDTADYTKIDPILGTEQDFTELCEAAESSAFPSSWTASSTIRATTRSTLTATATIPASVHGRARTRRGAMHFTSMRTVRMTAGGAWATCPPSTRIPNWCASGSWARTA